MNLLKEKVEYWELKVKNRKLNLIQQKNIVTNFLKTPEFIIPALISAFVAGLFFPAKKIRKLNYRIFTFVKNLFSIDRKKHSEYFKRVV